MKGLIKLSIVSFVNKNYAIFTNSNFINSWHIISMMISWSLLQNLELWCMLYTCIMMHYSNKQNDSITQS